jgi:hypothetical protein
LVAAFQRGWYEAAPANAGLVNSIYIRPVYQAAFALAVLESLN